MKTYKGHYIPKNREKYTGSTPVVYRSGWEMAVFKWLDANPKVATWGSETVVIPYQWTIEKQEFPNKYHRYFVDINFTTIDGRTYLVEIKPKSRTVTPKKTGKNVARQVEAILEHRKNLDKWEAAKKYAELKGWVFVVWTEDTLKSLGIKIFP